MKRLSLNLDQHLNATTTADSNITTMMTTNVITAATIFNLLKDVFDEGYSGILDLLNGFLIRTIYLPIY